MNISRYELRKNDDDYTLFVYVEPQTTEFGMELGYILQYKKDMNAQIRHLVREKFPNVPIKVAKVIAGSMLLTTFYLGATAPLVGAQTPSGQTQTLNDLYTVKAGDTLHTIAKRYNVTVDSIKKVNGLTSDMIFVGQQLRLPFLSYTVVSGDTLYNIAKRYNTTVNQLRSYNQLTTDMLMLGQVLRIPQLQPATTTQPVQDATATEPAQETTTTVQPTPTQPTTTYTVVAGDTLYGISVKCNTTVDQIKSLNNLTTNILNIGQVLKVPGTVTATPTPTGPEQEPPTETTTGPTGTTPTTGTTGPTGTTPTTEQPTGTAPTTGTAAPADTITQPNATQTYTVAPGDTLFAIAQRYNTTVSAIQTANKLTTTSIFVGQTLVIPGTQQAQGATATQPPADTTAPAAPTLSPVAPITTDNQSTLALSGTAEVNALVTLSITDGASTPVTVQVKADTNGRFQATVDVSKLNDGTVTITTTATDNAGNKSTQSTQIVKKDTRTDTPTLINTKVINTESVLAYPIKGTAEPGARVQVTFSDGVNPAITTESLANEKGEFSTFINLSKLRDGAVSVTTKAIDPSGNESGTTKITLTKDTRVDAPVLQEPQIITSKNEAIYPISGKAEPNSTITIRATDGANPPVEKVIPTTETGNFSATLNLAGLNDGSITITASSTDTAKNTSEPIQVTTMKDTFVAEPVLDTKQEVTNQNANQYTVFGVAEPGATVQLVISDGVHPEVTVQTIANESGEFRASVDLRTLNDGELVITATASDVRGNSSQTETTTIIKETTLAPPAINNAGVINSQTVTNYTIFGIAQPGTTVDITISDGVNPDILTSATTNENGEYHVNVDVSALLDTNLTISAFQTSAAGITSKETTISVQKDTQSPTAPIFHNNYFINSKNQTAYSLLGRAEKNTELHVRIFNASGQELKTTGVTDENGEYNIPVDLSNFADGEISFELTQVDQAGNVSPSVTKTLVKDTVGPTTLKLEPTNPVYSGNVFTYPIQGKAEPNSTLDIEISDGTRSITKTIQTDLEGNFEEIFDMSSLKDGELKVSFRASDNAGNSGDIAPVTIVKDTDAPAGVVTTIPTYVNSNNQSNYVISGSSVEEGATVEIVVGDGETTITRTTVVSNGVFTATFNLSGLADGALTFEARQTDRAGNRSIAQALTIEKDTGVEQAIASKNGFRYENLQYLYTVIGTAEANAQLEVTLYDADKNVLVTRMTDADSKGFYSLDIFVDQPSKVASATVTQTDLAGNRSDVTNVSLSTYTVSSGESLYSIAKRYNTTVDSLMTLNNLSSDVIQPNLQLRLPIRASEVVNLGYMYFGNTKEYVNTVIQTGHSVNIVSPSYFDINPDGTLKLTYQVDPAFIETMHKQGVRVVPFLSNHWNREVGRAMLQNKELAAQQIADAIARYNLDGVNVDIENVTDIDRDNYTEFVRLLRTKIPPTKEVSVAVAANPNGWNTGWHGSYDYTNLAKYADYLMIMAYDESYPGGDPGSVASYSWVEKSIQYALNQDVPPDKVVLGIAHFGRYWIEGQSYGGFGISNTQVETMIQRYNGTVVFDEISKTPKATVTIKEGDPLTFVGGAALSPGTYTIWFENEESIRHKLQLVSKYNIRGVGNWSLGQEVRGVWNSYVTTLPNTVPVLSPVYTEPVHYKTYSVVVGDSLWTIANRNNITVSELKEANGLTSDALYVGQVLQIPVDEVEGIAGGGTTTPTGTTTEVTAPPTDTGTTTTGGTVANTGTTAPTGTTQQAPTYTTSYTVVAGDSLSLIAQRNNTTVTAIKTANNLTSDTIYVGQVLKVPTNVITYTVVSGDTLLGIANRYNTTVTKIKTANSLTTDIIYAGQTLKIPVT
ncbi:LysM peptidoglycan-binding domain-containing protein [Fredinandcohnia humi]